MNKILTEEIFNLLENNLINLNNFIYDFNNTSVSNGIIKDFNNCEEIELLSEKVEDLFLSLLDNTKFLFELYGNEIQNNQKILEILKLKKEKISYGKYIKYNNKIIAITKENSFKDYIDLNIYIKNL